MRTIQEIESNIVSAAVNSYKAPDGTNSERTRKLVRELLDARHAAADNLERIAQAARET